MEAATRADEIRTLTGEKSKKYAEIGLERPRWGDPGQLRTCSEYYNRVRPGIKQLRGRPGGWSALTGAAARNGIGRRPLRPPWTRDTPIAHWPSDDAGWATGPAGDDWPGRHAETGNRQSPAHGHSVMLTPVSLWCLWPLGTARITTTSGALKDRFRGRRPACRKAPYQRPLGHP